MKKQAELFPTPPTFGAIKTPAPFTVRGELFDLCRCEHPKHAGQCPAPDGCWCDTFTPDPAETR